MELKLFFRDVFGIIRKSLSDADIEKDQKIKGLEGRKSHRGA